MTIRILYILLSLSLFALTQGVENSIIPLVDSIENLANLPANYFSENQYREIQNSLALKKQRLRIVSYNILSDEADANLGKKHHWQVRLNGVFELISEMQPDIVAMQELSEQQLNDLLDVLPENYKFYGHARNGDQEFNGFFYLKDRFIVNLQEIITIYDKGRLTNTITELQLIDKLSNKKFAVFNTHLPFSNPDKREFEIRIALEIMKPIAKKMPLIFLGDFNTFSHRRDLVDLPFYDGDYLEDILTENLFYNAKEVSLLGHVGPHATFTNGPNNATPFQGEGTPGIYLDRIFVTEDIQVLIHAVQQGTVDNSFPSDHMPIFIDCLLK